MPINPSVDRLRDYDFLNAIMTNLRAVALVIDTDGTIIFAEGKSITLAGLKSADVVGTNISKYFSVYPGFEERVRRALRGETFTATATAPNQPSFEITYSPMRDDQGLISGVIGVAQDVTERMKQDQALRNSEEKFRSITSATSDAIVIMDQTGLISMWNDAAQAIFGYTEPEVIGQNFYQLITPERYRDRGNRESIISPKDNPLTGKTLELIAAHKSGDEFPIELSLSAFRLNDQWHVMGTARDVTERKQVEKALRESEEKFSRAFHTNAALMAITDIQTNRFVDVNESFIKVMGFTRDEVIGRTAKILGLFVNFAERQAVKNEVVKGKSVRNYEATVRSKSGELRHGIFSAEKILLQGADCMLTVMVDITERKQAEELLRESERLLRQSQQIAQLGHYVLDATTGIWTSSDALDELFGIGPEFTKNLESWVQLIHPEGREEMLTYFREHVLRDKNPFDKEYRIVRANDSVVRWVHGFGKLDVMDGRAIRMFGTIQDVTERKLAQEEKERLQQQLQQSGKLEAIGTMASGIAHDFNNILTGILGFAELARLETPEGSSCHENLTEVLAAGRRARDLVRQILSFSRKAEMEKTLVSLVTVVREAFKLIRSVIPSHITIQQNFAASVERSILADPTQLHQIVMNLCLNAADAMPDGGMLEISVEEIETGTKSESEPIQPTSSRALKLTVSDSGVGMPPEVQERIFEPYFTTKQIGKGTGMGMAVVHGVVQDLGGNIVVASEQGKGTTITVCLPVVESAPCTQVISTPVISAGGESILFVDDEAMITSLQQLQLGKWGYRVTTTVSSTAALELFRANPKGYDLVITDLAMPGITGVKLAEAIHEINRETPIILCTGFEDGISRENAHLIGIQAILSKPIATAEFSRTIRMALDKASKLV